MSFSFTQGRWLYPYSVHWCSVRFPGPWTRLKRFKGPLVLYKWSPNMFWDWDIVDRSHLRIPSLKKRHKSFKRCCNSVKSHCVFDIQIIYKVAGFLVILLSIVVVDALPLPPLTHLSVPHLGFRAPKHPQWPRSFSCPTCSVTRPPLF